MCVCFSCMSNRILALKQLSAQINAIFILNLDLQYMYIQNVLTAFDSYRPLLLEPN